MINKRTRLVTTLFFSSILLAIGGCLKKDPESSIAQVLLVPLTPNIKPIAVATPAISTDFSINGTLYATSVGYNTTAGTVRYTFPYYTIEPKTGSLIAYNVTGTPNKYASVSKDLEADKVYSTFMIDTIGKIKAVIVTDDLTDPTPGKIKIRFFHFSPNAPAVDVLIQGTTNKLFANRSFNDQVATPAYESFIEIDPGTYTFVFNNAATGATVYTTSAQLLLTDRIYTIAARGVVGNATSPLGAWVYPNKP